MKRSIWYPVIFAVLTLVAISGLSDPGARSWMTGAAVSVKTALSGPGAVALRRSVLHAVTSTPVLAGASGLGFLTLAGVIAWFGFRRAGSQKHRSAKVRRLAQRGSAVSRIARETHLSQDAVRFLLPTEEPAGPARGTFFRFAPRRVRAAWRALRAAEV